MRPLWMVRDKSLFWHCLNEVNIWCFSIENIFFELEKELLKYKSVKIHNWKDYTSNSFVRMPSYLMFTKTQNWNLLELVRYVLNTLSLPRRSHVGVGDIYWARWFSYRRFYTNMSLAVVTTLHISPERQSHKGNRPFGNSSLNIWKRFYQQLCTSFKIMICKVMLAIL